VLYAFDGRKPQIAKGAYISDQAIVIGDVRIGAGCYVGPGAILRGDYGRIEIGSGTAVEENVTVRAWGDHPRTEHRRLVCGRNGCRSEPESRSG
jgi:carbonic anhydrase/acetyltransferase-like protein (isoleucine patch superfamily)